MESTGLPVQIQRKGTAMDKGPLIHVLVNCWLHSIGMLYRKSLRLTALIAM